MIKEIKAGPKNLITDVCSVKVGNAHDSKLKSGVSVVTSDSAFTASYAVLGGAPGSRETDLLAPEKWVEKVDALVLSGGSAFGLSAASAICNEMRLQKRGVQLAGQHVPIIPAAILFDLNNGGDKNWAENPYDLLGIQALQAASQDFQIGAFGAGHGAMAGQHKGGLGSASSQVFMENGQHFTIGALVAVNSFGSPFVPGTQQFWAAPFEVGDEFGGRKMEMPANPLFLPHKKHMSSDQNGANTTIGVIATDLHLSKLQAQRMAFAAHDGFARAIVPVHCLFDGDLVFAAATACQQLDINDDLQMHLEHIAALTMARAIARGVFNAQN